MLMTKDRRPAIRTLRGWAISVLQEAGAIRECEEHAWMQDRADPHSRVRALTLAYEDHPHHQANTLSAATTLRLQFLLRCSVGYLVPPC
jgi:hypothetical protein